MVPYTPNVQITPKSHILIFCIDQLRLTDGESRKDTFKELVEFQPCCGGIIGSLP